jgi:hypothetical protein
MRSLREGLAMTTRDTHYSTAKGVPKVKTQRAGYPHFTAKNAVKCLVDNWLRVLKNVGSF